MAKFEEKTIKEIVEVKIIYECDVCRKKLHINQFNDDFHEGAKCPICKRDLCKACGNFSKVDEPYESMYDIPKTHYICLDCKMSDPTIDRCLDELYRAESELDSARNLYYKLKDSILKILNS